MPALAVQTQIAQARIGTIAAGTSDERAIFVAPVDCEILKAYLTVGTNVPAGATNFTTFTLRAKGSAGTGTASLASFNTDAGQTSLTAFVPHSFGSLSNNGIVKGQTVTLDKVDSGAGDLMDEGLITIVWKPKEGLRQHET